MGGTWFEGRMAPDVRERGGVHTKRLSTQQRIHIAAVLTLLIGTLSANAQDFSFDPGITQDEFHEFASIVSRAIYASPVEPAGSRGLLAFDVGVAGIAVPVDEEAAYWVRSVSSDILTEGYLLVPRLVVSKGLGVANLSLSLARVPDSDIEVWGGALDVPIISGNLAVPTLSLRGAYADLRGVEELDMKTYGVELFLSKGFGPFTPYAAAGVSRTDTEGRIPPTAFTPELILQDQFEKERFTVGLRFSLLFPKIVIEATQSEDISYAAKVSFGL